MQKHQRYVQKDWYLMLTPVYTKQFERDLKRIKKQHKNIERLKIVLLALIEEEKLDPIYRDHKLIGYWLGRHECHIESDWLLIYKIENDRIIFERTGTHSDLFNK
jgi:mRNA interferase YafQ